jgi:putative drug exporter of the RND superfamily
MFDRLSGVINRFPWAVVIAGILFASLAGIVGGGVSKSLQSGGFQDPSSQSSAGVDRLQSATGLRADGGIVALVSVDQGIESSAAQSEVTKVAGIIAADPDVDHVLTYYQTHDASMLSHDGSSTLVLASWKKISDQRRWSRNRGWPAS